MPVFHLTNMREVKERDDKIYPQRTYTPVETVKLKSLNCIPNKKQCLLSTYSVSCSETPNPAISLSKGTCSLVKKGIQKTERRNVPSMGHRPHACQDRYR